MNISDLLQHPRYR